MTEKLMNQKPTKAGYIRIKYDGKLVMMHRLVWQVANGAIPNGMEVHHKNGVKSDNRIENLELLDRQTHRRLHEGWRLVDGDWYKPCVSCGEYKVLTDDNWYTHNGKFHVPRCKPCHVAMVVEARRLRND